MPKKACTPFSRNGLPSTAVTSVRIGIGALDPTPNQTPNRRSQMLSIIDFDEAAGNALETGREGMARRSGLQSRRNPCVVIASPDGAVVNSAPTADPELD